MSKPKAESESELIRANEVRAFDRWALPSFDSGDEHVPSAGFVVPAPVVETPPEPEPEPQVEEVPVEEVQPLTLEELEAISQDAYNEGFAAGEKDGFHAGQLKAKQEAEVALAAQLERMESLMQQLFEPIAEQDRELEHSLVDLLGHVVRQVIQRELQIDSSQLRQILREALKLLPMGAENVRIFLNPQDFELVKALRDRHEESWRLIEDEGLLPGGCRVETEQSRIDASVETRLSQALKQLFEQRREQGLHPPEADISVDLGEPSDAS